MCDPLPSKVGVYVTEHFGVNGKAPDSVHGLPSKAPGPSDVNVTAPVGFTLKPVSATVAVHVVDWPRITLAGEQLTAVDDAYGGGMYVMTT